MFLGWLRTMVRDTVLAGIEDAAVIAAEGSGESQQAALEFRRRLQPAIGPAAGADDDAGGRELAGKARRGGKA